MDELPAPRITVFIPAYNAERYIAEAIDSVLAQSYRDFELLLINDASTDATGTIMEGYASDARVRVIHHPTNQQRPRTRSEGVALARGEYIALLDADDRCSRDRLLRQAECLDANPDIDVVGSWWRRIDEQGRSLPAKKSRRYLSPAAIQAWLLFRCVIHNPTVMARTAVMRQFVYDPGFPIAEDYEVWARMLVPHKFAIMPAELTDYREHAEQVSMAQASDSLYFRQRVQARQLEALGVTFSEQDLCYHSLLYTGRHLFRRATGHDMNLAYVRWARRWLNGLLAANAERGIYDQNALRPLCARLWWFVCRKAAKQDGGAVWREFIASPLSRQVFGAYLSDGWTALRQR